MADTRDVILIKEDDGTSYFKGDYLIGPCHINDLRDGSYSVPEVLTWGNLRRIAPYRHNPIDGHFIALEEGHSLNIPELLPRPIIAHSEEELKEKMYARAVEVANLISERYKQPIENRLDKTIKSGLEVATQTP
jgi:hypothetical protein